MQPIKTTILSLTLAAATGAIAHAQNAAPAPSFTEPQAFNGYSQPEITDCKTVDATRRVCTIPAMTAGYYIVLAGGQATAAGANGVAAVQILLGGTPCIGMQTSKPFTGTKAIEAACQSMILTDKPLEISALFAVKEATADAKGPKLVI